MVILNFIASESYVQIGFMFFLAVIYTVTLTTRSADKNRAEDRIDNREERRERIMQIEHNKQQSAPTVIEN